MSKRHINVPTDTLEHLDYLYGVMEHLTKWEQDLIEDRVEAVARFGEAAVLTLKQIDSIRRIYFKIKLARAAASPGSVSTPSSTANPTPNPTPSATVSNVSEQ